MFLNIKKINIKNFRSYHEQSFDFVEFPGMTLVHGKNLDHPGQTNGSGKSSLMLAVCYGLYGDLPMTLKKENICNDTPGHENMEIDLEIESNGTGYRIISRLLKKKSSTCKIYKNENGEWTDITLSTIKATREFVENQLIGVGMDVFMRYVFINSDPSFDMFNMKPTERSLFIDNSFNLNIFNVIKKRVHLSLSDMSKTIAMYNSQLMTYNNDMDKYRPLAEEWEKRHASEIHDLEQRLKTDIDSLSSANKDTDNTGDISELEETRRNTKNMITSLNKELIECNDEINSINSSITRNESTIKNNNKFISVYGEIYDGVCSDCKPIVSGKCNIPKIRDENRNLNSDITTFRTNLGKFVSRKTDISSNISKSNSSIDEIDDLLRDANNRKIDKVKLESRIENDREILNVKKNEVNKYSSAIESVQKNIDEVNSKIKELSDPFNTLRFLEEEYKNDVLKKPVLENMIKILNGNIEHYLRRLGSDYSACFLYNGECIFTSNTGNDTELNRFSSGEQGRIRIATVLALRDLLGEFANLRTNLLYIDEFIDGNIDDSAISDIISVFKELSEKTNLFLISHRSTVDSQMFDHNITVYKKNRISKIKISK